MRYPHTLLFGTALLAASSAAAIDATRLAGTGGTAARVTTAAPPAVDESGAAGDLEDSCLANPCAAADLCDISQQPSPAPVPSPDAAAE